MTSRLGLLAPLVCVLLFAPHFAGNVIKYAGCWDRLPVDAQMLVALVAPRPVFATSGTTDQWTDVAGIFQTLQAAGPVYELLGKKGLGASERPAPDVAVMTGDLAFEEHEGGHIVTPGEWNDFLHYAEKYLRAK